jgi:hypothetical protein
VVAACGRYSVIVGWFTRTLCAGVVLTATPARVAVAHSAPVQHDFHVSYTRMAVESTVISAQIRMFSDDVTRALIERTRTQSVALNSPQGEAAFQAYVAEQFPIVVNGRKLAPVVLSGSQERDMWSYVLTWTSSAPITSIAMHNAVMMELFGDQQNIVKVKHLPSGKEASLFYSGGSKADQTIRF